LKHQNLNSTARSVDGRRKQLSKQCDARTRRAHAHRPG
jgi:hypothetical protein